MDSCNSESLQSSSDDDHESTSTVAALDHSSFSSSSAIYLNNLISDDILNQIHLQPPPLLHTQCRAQTQGDLRHATAPPPPSRNPRKRTRASRREPTTVLTTDTSNFKSMVQEFTGVPASPFSQPFSSATRRFNILRSPSDHHQPFIASSSFLNQASTSRNFGSLPDLPLPQVSTLQSLLSHQHHHHHNNQTITSSLHDLDTINLEALHQNQILNPTADNDHQMLMMRHFSDFNRLTEKVPASSSSSAMIKGSSGTTTTTTTIVDPWIFPTDSNN